MSREPFTQDPERLLGPIVELVLESEAATFRLARGIHLIGRMASCPVYLDDAKISRQQAELEVGGGGVLLRDLGSANGTFVNDQAVTRPVMLQEGDRLRIASYRFLVSLRRTSGA